MMLGIGEGMVDTVLFEELSWEKMEGAADEAGEADGFESALALDSDGTPWNALISAPPAVVT